MALTGDILDCLIVGGGPAGLTTALYLARFKRRFVVIDSGTPRAAWIPTSHNIPVFADGISGQEILARTRTNLEQYGATIQSGRVTGLQKQPDRFIAVVEDNDGGMEPDRGPARGAGHRLRRYRARSARHAQCRPARARALLPDLRRL